jgi:hypothetical protein
MNRRAAVAPVLALALHSPPLLAHRVLEHDVKVVFVGDGSVLRTTRYRVLVEDDGLPWVPPALALRDHESLQDFDAVVVNARRSSRVKGLRHWTAASIVEGTLDSELTTHWFELRSPATAKTVVFTHSVRATPFFPETVIEVPFDDACQSVRVEVVDPPQGFRYRLEHRGSGWVGEQRSGIVIERPSPCGAEVVERRSTPLVLHLAWGYAGSWGELGDFYADLLRRTPSGGPEIALRAQALLASGLDDPRSRLRVLAELVQREVRTVAVERRDGWYLPAPPSAVLARGWGDCKDKAVLLAGLLAEAGIEAHLALVDSSPGGSIDPAFPRLSAFDHLIVAVAERSLGASREGWTFVDPALPPQSDALHPLVPGRHALVLRAGGGSTLERVPAVDGLAILHAP